MKALNFMAGATPERKVLPSVAGLLSPDPARAPSTKNLGYYVQPTRNNYLVWTEELLNAAWINLQGTPTVNNAVADSNGGQAAFKITFAAANDARAQAVTVPVTVGQSFTGQVMVRNCDGVNIRMARSGTGTYEEAFVIPSNTTSWQAITVPITYANAQTGVRFDFLATKAGASVEVCFPQVVDGLVAKTYEPQASAQVLFDKTTTGLNLYLGSTDDCLLFSRGNVGLPTLDGQGYYTFLEDTATTGRYLSAQALSSGNITASIEAKYNGRRISCRESTHTGREVVFDLQTGTVVTVSSGAAGSMVALADGGYRCIASFTAAASLLTAYTQRSLNWYIYPDTVASYADANKSYTGDTTKGVKVRKPMVSSGLTFPATGYERSGWNTFLGATFNVEATDPLSFPTGLNFNGTSQYALLSPALPLGNSYTFTCICSAVDYAAFRAVMGTDQAAAYMALNLTGRGQVTAYSTQQDSVGGANPVTAGAKVVLTGVVGTGAGLAIYVNGLLSGSNGVATRTFGPRSLTTLGRNGAAGTLYHKGDILLSQAYPGRAFTAQDVRQQMLDFKRRGLI